MTSRIKMGYEDPDLVEAIAIELRECGYHVREMPSVVHIMDREWIHHFYKNKAGQDVCDWHGKIDPMAKILFSIHPQADGFLIANQTGSSDAKPTTLIPYDVPDMFERILNILGE